jgi:hypothetical protein
MAAISPHVPDATAPNAPALADPVAEARRVVAHGEEQGVTLRLIGGVAVCLQAPDARPLLPREIKDIDLVTPKGNKRAIEAAFQSLGYASDEAFNAFHGHHRQVYVDLDNERKVDVFVGSFAMCHTIPVADRLDRDPLTVPLPELLLTKLQIVELNERDERDIYSLCFHHDLDALGLEADFIADLLARDWGLWRTATGTLERCLVDVGKYGLSDAQQSTIAGRLTGLIERIEAAPKSSKWKMRNRVGDRVRWYEEPEEEAQAE